MRLFSQAEKEQYLLSLNEDEFREKVVRRLFKRLGFKDGRDLCGPEEQGKDAIFFEEDKFGGRSLVCVQTKKGAITLASDAQKNLHDIRAQVRTALESPYKCVQTKSVLMPDRVYLVASGRINQAARDWITSNVSNDPRIHYLDRDDLIRSLDSHCPEVWLNITADVFPYLHALSRLVEDQALVGLTSSSVAGIKSYYAASDAAFVDLKLIRSVSTAKKESGKITERFEFEEAGLSSLTSMRGERLLLLGDAGSGKSTLLVRAAYLMAREGAAGKKDYRVPVLVRAGDIAGDRDLISTMQAAVEQLAGIQISAFTADDLDQGRVALLVDGLDEVPRGETRAQVVQKINEFYAEHPRCSVALTTRPYSSIESIEGVRGFGRARIATMSLATAEKMLISYQRGAIDSKYTKEVLRRIDGIHGIELNPLLVTVFALTTDAERKDIPANITELFSKFTELMLGRWDEAKGISQQYQSRMKEHVVARFAHNLHAERRTQFSRDEFDSFATHLLASMNRSPEAAEMIDEILNRSGLFREAGDFLEFRHHLIQEYFAGRGIASLDQIKVLVSDEWWRNPIVFYFGSNPENVNGLLDVATSIGSRAGEAALTVGLSLQTCYLSRLEDRVDVWKWVVETLAGVTERVLQGKDEEKYPVFHFLSHYILSRDAVALSGIEKAETGAIEWAVSGNHFSTEPELRRFWAYVALLENGNLDEVLRLIKSNPLDNDHLNLAISFGCHLAEKVRAIGVEQKEAAKDIRIRLSPKVAVVGQKFAKEYRGQLLEYRRGAIVALDQVEPDGDTPGGQAIQQSEARIDALGETEQ